MPKVGPLRKSIEDFIETSPPSKGIKGWWEGVKARNDEMFGLMEEADETKNIFSSVVLGVNIFPILLYILTGWNALGKDLKAAVSLTQKEDLQGMITEFWQNAFETEAIEDMIDTVGTFTSEPILQMFEKLTPEDVQNPRAFVRRLHGTMIGLTLAPGILSTVLETLSLGQIETPAEIMKSIYWNFGLGFLGWQSIAPMMNAGMLSVLERHYNKEFRPKRFSPGELRDLFALGEISEERFLDGIEEQGWRDEDIDMWRRLAFKTLSEGDVHDALRRGMIDQTEWSERMRALGFDPKDMNILFGLNLSEDVDEAKAVSLSTSKRAFREGLMGEAEFREVLADLNKSEREIDLLVAMEREGMQNDLKIITVSQVKQAWEENVLSDPEAAHWLMEHEFGAEEIDILLSTWKAQAEPVFRKLNKGSIVGAYVTAVINRSQAASKLESVGFSPDDARLELDLAEARAPEVFGAVTPPPTRHLAPGILGEMLEVGLISGPNMVERLLAQGFEDEDAQLLTAAAILRAEGEDRPLTQQLIERAYAALVIDWITAAGYLVDLGFDEEETRIILVTVEQENPWVFDPESVQAIRVPTIGALVEATRVGIITEIEFFARAVELGLNREGAELYLALALHTERKRMKSLTKSEISNLYEAQKFDFGTAMMRLMSLGYNNEDATLILWMDRPDMEDHEVWKMLVAGLIQPLAAFTQLMSEGYNQDEIDAAIEGLG